MEISICVKRACASWMAMGLFLVSLAGPARAGNQDIGIELPASIAPARLVVGAPVVGPIGASAAPKLAPGSTPEVAKPPSQSAPLVPQQPLPQQQSQHRPQPLPQPPPTVLLAPMVSGPAPRPETLAPALQWLKPGEQRLLDSVSTPATFKVVAIAGEGDAYSAVLEYKGATYVVTPGTLVPDQDDPAFQVRDISADRVEVYDPVTKRIIRRSLSAPGVTL